MEAAIGYQKISPRPMTPPPIRACPNRGNDFQPSKLTAMHGNQFCYHVDKPPWKADSELDRTLIYQTILWGFAVGIE